MSKKREVIFNVIGDLVEEAIRVSGLEDSVDPDDPSFVEFLEAKLCEVLTFPNQLHNPQFACMHEGES